MITSIEIYGQRELESICKDNDFNNSILISIGNPHRILRRKNVDEQIPKIFKTKFDKILRLEFYDVSKKSDLQKTQVKRIPKENDVKKAIRFFEQHRDKKDRLIIHCWGGVSRSTAIGICILYLILQDEESVITKIGEIRKEALPNAKIKEIIDNIYKTGFTERRYDVMKNWKNRFQRELFELMNEGLEEV